MRRFTTRVLFLLGSLTAAPALAQSPAAKYVGRPVEQIRLLVENTPSVEPSLLDVIEVREGQALSIAAIRESIGHLHGLGRFQDVQVDASDAPGGGVVLSFNLIPMHAVQRIDFKGTLGLSESLLRRTVVDRYGASPPIGRAADAARALQLVYADHGYLRAKIQPVPEIRHDPDRTLLTFEVDAGARAAIGHVTVEGDPGEPTAAFLHRDRRHQRRALPASAAAGAPRRVREAIEAASFLPGRRLGPRD